MNKEELNALAKEIHELAKEKGWWNEKRLRGEVYALIHSEISEAVEEARLVRPPMYFVNRGGVSLKDIKNTRQDGEFEQLCKYGRKPQGELIELADVVIRCMDYIAYNEAYLDCEYEIEILHDPLFDINSIELYAILHSSVSALYDEGDRMIWSFIQMVDHACNLRGWNLWEAVRIKHEYNKTHSYRHGGKKY